MSESTDETMISLRCFLNEEVPCPGFMAGEGHFALCKAWNQDQQECELILLMRRLGYSGPQASFPDSAPPPEVR